MIAIAAMALNRVIGADGKIPWHLSADLKFFKRTTLGHVIVMGRKTYESLGRPLPGRENWVITRAGEIPGVRIFRDPGAVGEPADGRTLFVVGGAQIYTALLPRCEEVLLTVVKRSVEGDTFFPVFEQDFDLREVLMETPDMEVRRYVRRR